MASKSNPSPEHPRSGDWPGRPARLRAPALDADAGALLWFFNLASARRRAVRYPLRQMRWSWRFVAAAFGRTRPVARVQTLRIPGPGGTIELRAYQPRTHADPHADRRRGGRPAFVWFHGGAFMIGGLATADSICRNLAHASGAVVLAVRYRLVPEHDLYAGREDGLAALDWLARNGRTLGIDPARIAIGGDSAGGNIAAALAQRWTDLGHPSLRLQVLVYPATNLCEPYPSKAENAEGYMLDERTIDWVTEKLQAMHADLSEPWLSPHFRADLSRLPPALLVSAGYDPIRDDGLDYARQLRAAGVPVELLHYPGEFHGFLNFDGVLGMARDALERIGASLARALADADAAPAAPDRTVEVRSPAVAALPAPRLLRDAIVAGLMTGDRLEQLRSALSRALVPALPMPPAAEGLPLLYPLTALRGAMMAQIAPSDARETWAARLTR